MFAVLFFYVRFKQNSQTEKNIKMLKRKSDDELEILEKLVKKKQFGLIFILVALSVLIKQITTEKQRKHPLQHQYY